MLRPFEKDMMNMHWLQTISVILWAVKPHLLSIFPSSLWKLVPWHSGQVNWRPLNYPHLRDAYECIIAVM